MDKNLVPEYCIFLSYTGQPMIYQEFTNKYSCKTNFLQYYQVISAIPKHLLAKAKSTKPINKELYSDDNLSLQLNESITLYLNKIKTSDFYMLLCTKIHTTGHSGPQRSGAKIFPWMKINGKKYSPP